MGQMCTVKIWHRLLRNTVHVGRTLVLTVFFFSSALNCNGERKPTESIDFTKPMFSSLTADQKKLLLDYHKNYSRLVDYYNNCTMKLRQDSYSIFRPSDTEGIPPPPGRKLDDEPKGITRYVYYGNGGNHFRLDRTKCDPADPSSILNSYTGIITPSDSYILQAEADNFSVREHRGMKESDLYRLRSYVFVNAPYAYAGHPLRYMLFQNPGSNGIYTIDDIAIAKEDSKRIVTISSSITNKHGVGNFVLELLPDDAWALQELVYTSTLASEEKKGKDNYEEIRCKYKKDSQNMPQLHEMIYEGGNVQEDGTVRLFKRDRYTVESFTAGPADISEFDAKQLVGDDFGKIEKGEETGGGNGGQVQDSGR